MVQDCVFERRERTVCTHICCCLFVDKTTSAEQIIPCVLAEKCADISQSHMDSCVEDRPDFHYLGAVDFPCFGS